MNPLGRYASYHDLAGLEYGRQLRKSSVARRRLVNLLRRLGPASAAAPRPVGSILSAVVDHASAGSSVFSRLRAVHFNPVSRWRCGHGRPARGRSTVP